MKTKQIRHYKREFKLKKMELQEQELDEEILCQGKKDKDYPNTYLETRSKPIERNQGMRIGDVNNHPDINNKLWERNKYGFPKGLEIR